MKNRIIKVLVALLMLLWMIIETTCVYMFFHLIMGLLCKVLPLGDIATVGIALLLTYEVQNLGRNKMKK